MTQQAVLAALLRRARQLVPPGVPPDAVTPSARLHEDLRLDSLGLISLVFGVEEEFEIDVQPYAARFAASRTIEDLAQVAEEALAQQGARPPGWADG